jgi:hypothetical protein
MKKFKIIKSVKNRYMDMSQYSNWNTDLMPEKSGFYSQLEQGICLRSTLRLLGMLSPRVQQLQHHGMVLSHNHNFT